jgi:hypothetical protein
VILVNNKVHANREAVAVVDLGVIYIDVDSKVVVKTAVGLIWIKLNYLP